MERAEAYLDDVVRFLRDLIRIQSRSGQEGEAMRRIEREMKALGLANVGIDPIGNVVGWVGSGPYRILYDSHIDTVGVGDEAAWPHDPYEGKFENGIVYGRGASDNKAAIACMVYAGKIMMELGLGAGASLCIAGVVQEEDCDGWAGRGDRERVLRRASALRGAGGVHEPGDQPGAPGALRDPGYRAGSVVPCQCAVARGERHL